MAQGWDPAPGSFPRAPSNVQIMNPYGIGVHDIRWDNPVTQWANAPWTTLGVNIYRSDVSSRGPYFRINQFPLGTTFYRDQTEYVLITQEVVDTSQWVYQGDGVNDRRFVFRTKNPIVKKGVIVPYGPHQTPVYGNAPTDVIVSIDGESVIIDDIFGRTGEVTLINQPTIDAATEKCIAANLPTATSLVLVTYYTAKNFIQTGLDAKIHYRLTTVVADPTSPIGILETPLQYAEPHFNIEIETLDYIWREAIRRNNWILEQGGERVKVFIRKQNGAPCSCPEYVHIRNLEQGKQPSNRCEYCFGTGFVGGYEGPYDVIIAPDDGERRVSQQLTGRRLEHSYEVWMGPSPLVTQRDFFVKQTNERYSIGPVRRPTNRGNVLQQHFSIAFLDLQDIRYKMCLDDPSLLVYPETRRTDVPPISYPGRQEQPGYIAYLDRDGDMTPPYPVGKNPVSPLTTEKGNIPDDRELRGKSQVWENIEY